MDASTSAPAAEQQPTGVAPLEEKLGAIRTELADYIAETRAYQNRSDVWRKDTEQLLGAIAANALKQNFTIDNAFGAVQKTMVMASSALSAVEAMASRSARPSVPRSAVIALYLLTAMVSAVFVALVFLAAQGRPHP